MNICTPGTHYHDMSGKLVTDHCVNASPVTKPVSPAWTAVSALFLGDSLMKHMVGKDTVFRYKKTVLDNMTPLKEGYIVIQAESSPVQFRKIELLNLVGCMTKGNAAYRPYFVKHNAQDCSTVGVAAAPEAPPAFRLRRSPGGIAVEGAGRFSAVLLAPDGSVLHEARGTGSLRLAAARPGLHLVRVVAEGGQALTLKAVLPGR
jgi:hypothetical protein